MTLKSKSKLLKVKFIDSIISAAILRAKSAPTIRHVWLKHNILSLPGTFNPSAVCMDDDICTIPVHPESTCNTEVRLQIADDLKITSLAIWDEIFMSH